jgi:DNA-binding CsgD family transcriptional regulator
LASRPYGLDMLQTATEARTLLLKPFSSAHCPRSRIPWSAPAGGTQTWNRALIVVGCTLVRRSSNAGHRQPAKHLSLRVDGRHAVLLCYRTGNYMPGRLTNSEIEVAELALHGHSNRSISRLRGTSVNTVASQLRSVYRKLGICARSELASAIARADGAGPRGS